MTVASTGLGAREAESTSRGEEWRGFAISSKLEGRTFTPRTGSPSDNHPSPGTIHYVKNPDTQAFNCPKWPSTDNSSGLDKGALSGGDCPYTSGLDGQG